MQLIGVLWVWQSISLRGQTYTRYINRLYNNSKNIVRKRKKYLICTWLYPPLQRSWKGGILVSPCPSVRPSVCPSVDRIVSALYLQQYSSDPFHICTSYQAISEGVSRVMFVSKLKNFGEFFKFVILTVFFWLGIQYDSIVWVIMAGGGGGGDPQKAGDLVVLVCICFCTGTLSTGTAVYDFEYFQRLPNGLFQFEDL